ncbi:UDP-N-acetylmuramate--alanine ligase [Sphingorhabdus lutea]|uniref:UDP-N-acetylmuramate--alanine ligase n=1 Tax=Sphingorhabdus lutea TaxID=1913578 RepID=A0A1L3JBG5_9SPHN|nr:Mur ligase family protein [Sphingorhabdus lutea]APG62439.1 UDP-N-acetylmuramate--alanine ligase [Sphingorhabdus lutea]
MTKNTEYYFCGIGGSGMLPLATLVQRAGYLVKGSDRSYDQGRIADKFLWLQDEGIEIFPQDGSGITHKGQILVASAAVEDSVADVVAARKLGLARMTRAELLASLFNKSNLGVAIGGTSGKSTVTGMIGWIAHHCGLSPKIMNGAVMKNFISDKNRFASAISGDGEAFISEVDESDGSIALFNPQIAVLNNITLDHKSMEELHQLFGDFAAKAPHLIWNIDDVESRKLMDLRPHRGAVSFGFTNDADFCATNIILHPMAANFDLLYKDEIFKVALQVPGKHNIANALAAIAASMAMGIKLSDAIAAIGQFSGLRRRFEMVGTTNGITIIDDFGHNPDKIAATLSAMKSFNGRVIAFFQPHGFGPLRLMKDELAEVFAKYLTKDDQLIICDPVYFGGTVDKSVGTPQLVEAINAHQQVQARHIALREECGAYISAIAETGDRIAIMGARDDSLSLFAADMLEMLANSAKAD